MSNNKYQIVLIRHGYSLGNALKTLSGQSDVPLLEKGRKELVSLRKKYKYLDTDLYYSSDLSRCTATFDALFAPERKLDGMFKELREINFKQRENELFVSRDILVGFFEKWIVNDPSTADVESFEEIKNRMLKIFYKTLNDLKTNNLNSATLCTHSCAMRCLLIGLDIYKLEDYWDISVKNGQGFVLDIEFDNDVKITKCTPLLEYIDKR